MLYFKGDSEEDKKYREEAAKRLDNYYAEAQAKNQPQSPVYTDKPDILDTLFNKTVARPNATPFLPQYEQQIKRDINNRDEDFVVSGAAPRLTEEQKKYAEIDRTLQNNPGLSSTLAGTAAMLKGLPFGERLTKNISDTPEKQQMIDIALSQHPTLSKIYGIAGGVGSTMGAGALLAPLRVAKGTGIVSNALNTGTQAAALQPVISATNWDEDKSTGENLAKIGKETAGAFVGGTLLGGATKGLSNLYGNTVGFNKALQRTGQAIDDYKIPQLREMQTVSLPERPSINPTIPTKYQNLPKIEEPLMLPPANPYRVAPEFRTEMAGLPSRNTTSSQAVEPNLKPINAEGNINSLPNTKTTFKPSLNPNGMKTYEIPNIKNAEVSTELSPSIPKPKYSPEIQNKLNDMESQYQQNVSNYKKNNFFDAQTQSKRLKGMAMEYSAAKREVIQGDSLIPVEGGLTAIELSNKIKNLKTNYIGKEVITPDGEGIIHGNSFGKVGVKYGNGEIRFYTKEQIQPKTNIDEVISQQKQAIKEPMMNQNTVSNMKSPVIENTPIKTQNTVNEVKSLPTKNRQFIQNSFMESQVPTKEMKIKMNRNMPQYEPLTNKETLDKAMSKVDKDYNSSVREFLTSDKLHSADDTALGQALIQRAIQNGNHAEANDIAINLAEKLTNAGQTVQAASMFRRMTPEGMLQYANKVINKANKELASKAGNKAINKIKLTENEAKFITDTMSEVQSKLGNLKLLDINLQLFADSKVAEVMKLIASKIPANMGEKVKAFQRINLLFNPKTMIRNALGNVISSGVANIKDVLATGIDKGLSKITGQRTTLLPSLKTQFQGAKKGFNRVVSDYKKGINTAPTGTQYEINGRTISPFKNKALMNLDELTKTGLRIADDPFYQSAYDDVLRKEMKLKGVDTPAPDMIAKADQIARERTFQDTNRFTKAFQGIQKAFNHIGTKNFGLGNIILPFVKTPANILARAVEYSPAEIIKGTGKALIDAYKGNAFDQYKFVDSLAKSITGTGLVGAGYYLAQKGIISGASAKDKDARNFQSDVGILPYSFKVGDKTYTYDWAQPSSIPLAIGADIYYNLKQSKEPGNVILDASKSGLNTLFSQSLLQGLNKMFGGSGNSVGSDVATNLANTALSATSQFIPMGSSLRQIGEVIDPYKRDTSDESQIKSKAINPLINTIPGLRQSLPPKINTVGEPVKANGFIDTFINPARTSDYNGNATYDELLRLNNEGGENKQFPTTATNSISYKTSKKGEPQKLILPPKDLATFQQSLGQSNMQAIQKVMDSGEYQRANDKQKAELISKAMSKNKQEQENKLLKSQGINEYEGNSSNSRSRRSR